jgi:hypothetical protein
MAVTTIKIPAPLRNLIKHCETECVAACCYEDAFDLSPEQVRCWIEAVGNEEFATAQSQLARLIWQVEYTIGKIDCQPFCWLDERDDLLTWLRRWEKVISL